MENNFLGKGWGFPPEFGENGAEVQMVSGEEDIRQSLIVLLSTSLNERLMNPEFGCDLDRFLFEETNQLFINELSNTVSKAILRHEPRVGLEKVQLDELDEEGGLISITVDYLVRATNNRFNLVYPFYLKEATAAAFTIQ
ncbi:MAG: GPW/gp25 family protein [Bacteroidota bacterium]